MIKEAVTYLGTMGKILSNSFVPELLIEKVVLSTL